MKKFRVKYFVKTYKVEFIKDGKNHYCEIDGVKVYA